MARSLWDALSTCFVAQVLKLSSAEYPQWSPTNVFANLSVFLILKWRHMSIMASHITKNINVPLYWPFIGGICRWPLNYPTRAINAVNVFMSWRHLLDVWQKNKVKITYENWTQWRFGNLFISISIKYRATLRHVSTYSINTLGVWYIFWVSEKWSTRLLYKHRTFLFP